MFLELLHLVGRIFIEFSKTKFLIILIGSLFVVSVRDITGQLHRLGVVLLATLMLGERNPCLLLTLKPLIALGDCSYSVYLVHWPLFTLHRYYYPELYTFWHNYPTYVDKFLKLSLILGFSFSWLSTDLCQLRARLCC